MRVSRNRTEQLFILSRILYSPLEAMYTLLIFIMSISLNASNLQLTILACCKPIISLFAYQAVSLIIGRAERIRCYMITLNVLGCAPCLFFPIIDNIWFYLASYIIFLLSLRALFPPWAEILKIM